MPPHLPDNLEDEVYSFDDEIDVSEVKGSCDDFANSALKSSLTDVISDATVDPTVSTSHPSRRVSFSDTNQVHSIFGVSEYTYAEHRATWFSPYEITQMRFYRDKLLCRLEKGKPCKSIHGKEMTYRGLESCTQAGANLMRQSNLKVIRAVVSEQNRQRKLGFCDQEEIASKVVTLTAESRHRAYFVGKEDEKEAMEIHFAGKSRSPDTDKGQKRRRSWWSFTMSSKR